MWNRKELKSKAKEIVRKNYWTVIVVCFIVALLTGEYGTSIIRKTKDEVPNIYYTIEREQVNGKEVDEGLIEEYTKVQEIQEKISSLPDVQIKLVEAVKSNIASAIKTQIYILKVWDATKFFSINENVIGIEMSITALLTFLFAVFIAEPLIVAGKRFFIQIREKSDTKISSIVEIFKKGYWINVVKTMFLKNLYVALWFLTIIGGLIKIYEYRMIPYILADNPEMKSNEVFKLSKKMMKGNKWDTFVLDLSFIGWDILSILTFGLVNILYANSYRTATMTELYTVLKGEVNSVNN